MIATRAYEMADENKKTGGGQPPVPNSNGSPLGAVCDQDTLEAWRKQVIRDRGLNKNTTLVLLTLSFELDEWEVKPVASQIYPDLNMSDATYYRAIKQAKAAGYLEKSGEFEYQTRGKTSISDSYRLTFPEDGD